jgi:hypothetical protein
MKNGDVRKLPKSNSPMWSEMWAVQDTATVPYVVFAKKKAGNGITTGWDMTWGCSCGCTNGNCTHIILVKLKEGFSVDSTAIVGALDSKTKKKFENFLAHKQTKVVEFNSLKEKGRKFRTE